MKRSSLVWLIVVIIVAIVGIYVWVSMAQQQNVSPTTGPYGSATSGDQNPTGGTAMTPLTLNTMESTGTLGTFLVATNGMTLYKYTRDAANVSNCTGQCAAVWPPYTVSGSDAASLAGATGINGQLGTIKRADGSMQVTYNGMPLYFYAKDKNPGDTTGQNVGGVWFVVAP